MKEKCTFRPILLNNIVVAIFNIITYIITVIILLYYPPYSLEDLLADLSILIFTGIAFLGFVAVAVHIQYLRFEWKRKIELLGNKMIISRNNKTINEIFVHDILDIIVYDKINNSGANLFVTNVDSYYYLVITLKTQEKIIITRLMDIHLKKKIADWSNCKIEHHYRFFPFIKKEWRREQYQ